MEEGAQDGQYERYADAPDAPRPCLRSPSHGNYHLCLPSCAIGYFTIEIAYVYFGIAMVILYNVLLIMVAKLSGIRDFFHSAFVKLQKNENISITKEAHPGKSLTLL